jgi:hypothetical protein
MAGASEPFLRLAAEATGFPLQASELPPLPESRSSWSRLVSGGSPVEVEVEVEVMVKLRLRVGMRMRACS